ncbi:MAG: hypothetical protein M1821_006536 [Bathelium mastoideum]|nr:MAG: hypothetical protein M1821_006536 [Bathelium mastoideum]
MAENGAPNSPTDRRRSSGEKFAALHNLKRNSNPDAFAQRRTSVTEQTAAKPGFFGQLWHNYTRGGAEKK